MIAYVIIKKVLKIKKLDRKIKIFHTDDNNLFRSAVEIFIRGKNNYKFIGYACNGREALEKIPKLGPDIALIDINMPIMNGVEVCKRLRMNGGMSKVIILSSYKDPELVQSMIELGANGYVLKADILNELEIAISEVLDGNTYISAGIEH